MKNIGTVFLHTDAQIPDERFLVLINDMLASGLDTLFEDEVFFCFFVTSENSCFVLTSFVLFRGYSRPFQ